MRKESKGKNPCLDKIKDVFYDMKRLIGGSVIKFTRLDKMSGLLDILFNLFLGGFMNLLKDNIRKIFFRYLLASFGSALIVAVYSIVDCAIVGQYEGSMGVAALATVAPIWNIIYSLGLLFGIGGAVLMSAARGCGDEKRGHEIFTSALIGVVIVALCIWLIVISCGDPMLRFFGANDTLLPLAKKYLHPIKATVPLFVFGQFLAAFLRNDNAPGRATIAVLAGGIFNVFGDYFFVFLCHMGIQGAGLATALGQTISFVILLSHFFGKNCGLRLTRPPRFLQDLKDMITTGFPTFFIDIAMGLLSVMFNNQIMHYAGSAALAVYGVIININILVQSCSYSIGQAAQPILSINFGAKNEVRVKQTFFWSLVTAAGMALFWTGITMGFPIAIVNLFMRPSKEVLAIASPIMRSYFLSFLLLPLNIYSTYYFQAVMKPKASFLISVLRGVVISGFLIYVLPIRLGVSFLWLAMPITELLTAVPVIWLMVSSNKQERKKG